MSQKPTAQDVWTAIAALPGKTIQPWKDGDAREHCSHCVLCAECYPTRVLSQHTAECAAAILAALNASQPNQSSPPQPQPGHKRGQGEGGEA